MELKARDFPFKASSSFVRGVSHTSKERNTLTNILTREREASPKTLFFASGLQNKPLKQHQLLKMRNQNLFRNVFLT
jgi:hypothetical protein